MTWFDVGLAGQRGRGWGSLIVSLINSVIRGITIRNVIIRDIILAI